MSCTFDLTGTPSGSQRRFAGMTGLPLINPGGSRMVSLATVLRFIFRRALVQHQRHAAAAFRRDQLVLVGAGPGRRGRGAAA